MANPNASYGEIVSTTLDRYSPRLYDNVLNHNALLARLMRKGRATMIDGGDNILENLEYGENGTAKWYSGLELLDVSASDVFTSANFSWKQFNANVVVSGLDEIKNAGRQRVHNLVVKRIQNAEKTMKNNVAAALFYSNTEQGGKAIGGLQHLVSDTPATGTVGGIDASAQSFWRNQVYDFSDEAITASSSTIQAAMNRSYINAQRQRDTIDMFIADANYFTFYLESLQAQQRFMDDKQAGAGFQSLKFWGGASDVFYDVSVPTNHMYGLNTDYIYFRTHRNRNFRRVPEKSSVNQDASVTPLFWAGNMTVSNRSLQAVILA